MSALVCCDTLGSCAEKKGGEPCSKTTVNNILGPHVELAPSFCVLSQGEETPWGRKRIKKNGFKVPNYSCLYFNS